MDNKVAHEIESKGTSLENGWNILVLSEYAQDYIDEARPGHKKAIELLNELTPLHQFWIWAGSLIAAQLNGPRALTFLSHLKILSTTGYAIRHALFDAEKEIAGAWKDFQRLTKHDNGVLLCDRPISSHLIPEEYIASQSNIKEKLHNKIKYPFKDLTFLYNRHSEYFDFTLLKEASSGYYIQGDNIKNLENTCKSYLETKNAITTSSGTDSLLIALRTESIFRYGKEFFNKDKYIITSPLTFTSTIEAIIISGATPLLIDIDLNTGLIQNKDIQDALISHKNIIGIIPVHLYGQGGDIEKIIITAQKNDIFVIEDAAQAFGSMSISIKKLGTLGTYGAFSFYPTKNIGSMGDGGLLITNCSHRAKISRRLVNHGGDSPYNPINIGYNSRLDSIHAPIINKRLYDLDNDNKIRQDIAKLYNSHLLSLKKFITPLKRNNHNLDSFNQYTIRVHYGKRNELIEWLKEKNILTSIYYDVLLHKTKAFLGCVKIHKNLQNYENICKELLSLPINLNQSTKTTQHICNEIIKFYHHEIHN